MEALIKITENNGQKAVSARELHSFLESKKDFSNWIKHRIEKYGLIENVDFIVLAQKGENLLGGRPTIEYALSIDAAKELSMVEGNAKGKQARKYFIECEKKSLSLAPTTYKEALVLALQLVEKNEQLALEVSTEREAKQQAQQMISLKESEIELKDEIINHHLVEISHKEQELRITAPKAATYDAHISSKETLTTTNIAMEIGMSAVKLNRLLEERGVQRKVNGIWTLNAKYSNHGYAVLKPHIEVNQVTGESKTYYQMVWTAKGRIWIKENVERITSKITI